MSVAVAVPGAVLAEAQLAQKRGDVQAGYAGTTAAPLAEHQRIFNGATVTTASGGQALLRFDDGLEVALYENSALRIATYRYRSASGEAVNDHAVFDLQRGAMRVTTGAMAERSPAAFQLRAPQAALRVREAADFTVALVNPMYLSVAKGSIVATNSAGGVAIMAGTTAQIASSTSPLLTMQPSALPAQAASAVAQLGKPPVAGGASGGAGMVGGVAQTVSRTTLIVVGAVIAGVLIVAAQDDDPAPAATSH